MFSGNVTHQIDQKGRIRIPAKFKVMLGDNYVITTGVGGCLFVLPEIEAERFYKKISVVPITDIEGMKAVRKFMAGMCQPDEDNQGRFILPISLRKFAKIQKQVVFVGVGERIELWSLENWQSYYGDESSDNFDDNIQVLAKYGI